MPFAHVRIHYERHPYPYYSLLTSVRRHDTYAMNLQALWARFNGEYLAPSDGKILIAGSGAFSPYPASLANQLASISAVDLADSNNRRARLHCLLHGCRNVTFIQGDFLHTEVASGPFHLIDAFGVLHHLDNPAEGLKSLEQRLLPGGILRVMVYGRYARKEAESIRRAAHLLGIRDIHTMKRLLHRAPHGSRVREYVDASWEARSDSGIADIFLHPSVHTYRMDEFLRLVSETGLKPLLFAHADACPDPDAEIERFRKLDTSRESRSNIVCYLGKEAKGSCFQRCRGVSLLLNPSLSGSLSPFSIRPAEVMPRLGHKNPVLDSVSRRFLRRFRAPVPVDSLSESDLMEAEPYLKALFLVSFVPKV
jgi:2-polyprenyl-3-methyl-5-hydroxy-6-metoxy-1,4-benzoquinol methylase